MRLKIDNQTHYKTDELRRIFLACMKQEGVKNCNILVKYSKKYRSHNGIHGRAWLNSTRVIMLLPKTYANKTLAGDTASYQRELIKSFPQTDIDGIGRVFIHELGHNRGLRHEDMARIGKLDVGVLQGYQLTAKEEKPKAPRNLRAERYEQAKSKVKEYQTKLKRTHNLLKKWNKKVKYYEKVMN